MVDFVVPGLGKVTAAGSEACFRGFASITHSGDLKSVRSAVVFSYERRYGTDIRANFRRQEASVPQVPRLVREQLGGRTRLPALQEQRRLAQRFDGDNRVYGHPSSLERMLAGSPRPRSSRRAMKLSR